MTSQLQALPKTELHCHLDGSLSLAVIRQLADLAAIAIPKSDDDLRALTTAPSHVASLNDYLKTFDFIRPLLQTEEALRLAAYDVVKQAAADNIIYIEIRFAPELSMDQGLTASQVVAAVEAGLRQAQTDLGVVAKALICGLRQTDPRLTKAIFSELTSNDQLDFVGLDFAGNEHDFAPAAIEELLDFSQNLGYPMTFHAGECGCPHHIAQALNVGLRRLGHVTAIKDQPQLLADFVQAGATAELCLTSNLQTKAAASLADFPYEELYEAGARITINTDNRTVSATNLTREYELFQRYFGTTVADFYAFNRTALAAAFATDEEKKALLARLEAGYQDFL